MEASGPTSYDTWRNANAANTEDNVHAGVYASTDASVDPSADANYDASFASIDANVNASVYASTDTSVPACADASQRCRQRRQRMTTMTCHRDRDDRGFLVEAAIL